MNQKQEFSELQKAKDIKSIINFYGVFQETILGIMVEDIKNEDEKYEWT